MRHCRDQSKQKTGTSAYWYTGRQKVGVRRRCMLQGIGFTDICYVAESDTNPPAVTPSDTYLQGPSQQTSTAVRPNSPHFCCFQLLVLLIPVP